MIRIIFYIFMKLINNGTYNSFFILMQSFTVKKYPAELSLTAWICFVGVFESAVASFIMERDMSVWAIGWDSKLLACIYSVSTFLS